MTRSKLALWILLAVIVAIGGGYAWGAGGRREVQRTLTAMELRADLAEARGHILEARVALYNLNFGDASRHLEMSKRPLQQLKTRLRDDSRDDLGGNVDTALVKVNEAQQLANKLDQAANSRAAEALTALEPAKP